MKGGKESWLRVHKKPPMYSYDIHILPLHYLLICLYTVALDTPTILLIFSLFTPNPYRVLIISSLGHPTLVYFLLEWDFCILFNSSFPFLYKFNNKWCSFLTFFIFIWFSSIYKSNNRNSINIVSF